MSYWDTSCLIKLYTPEPDSSFVRTYLANGSSCVTCDIAPLEFWATVRRKESEGVLAPGEARQVQNEFEADLDSGMIVVMSCDSEVRALFVAIVEQCHSLLPPIFIRTNDALHLAAAQCAAQEEIVATDKRMREAALALGFTVLPHAQGSFT